MTILTKHALGMAVREVIYDRYTYINKDAEELLGYEAPRIRDVWGRRGNKKAPSFKFMMILLDKLGYEVHFELVRTHYGKSRRQERGSDSISTTK